MTARHDKATGGRTEAAAVDRAIAKVGRYLDDAYPLDSDGHAALRVLADAVEDYEAAKREYEKQREYADEQYRKALAAEAERDNIKRDYDDVFGQLTRRHGDVHRLARQVADLEGLLDRVEPELCPNHDAAEELREKLLGGPPDPTAALINDIRAARSRDPQAQPSADREEPQT